MRRTVLVRRPIRTGTFPTPITRRLIRTRTQIRRPLPNNANSSRQRHRQMRMSNTSRAFLTGTLIRRRHRRRPRRRTSTSRRTARRHRILTHRPPTIIIRRTNMLLRTSPLMTQRRTKINRKRCRYPSSMAMRTSRGSRRTKHRGRFKRPTLRYVRQ